MSLLAKSYTQMSVIHTDLLEERELHLSLGPFKHPSFKYDQLGIK